MMGKFKTRSVNLQLSHGRVRAMGTAIGARTIPAIDGEDPRAGEGLEMDDEALEGEVGSGELVIGMIGMDAPTMLEAGRKRTGAGDAPISLDVKGNPSALEDGAKTTGMAMLADLGTSYDVGRMMNMVAVSGLAVPIRLDDGRTALTCRDVRGDLHASVDSVGAKFNASISVDTVLKTVNEVVDRLGVEMHNTLLS